MWPEEIRLMHEGVLLDVLKMRKRPAAQDARCAIDGVKDAQRVYEGKIWRHALCLRHAKEWAALKGKRL